MLPKVSVIIPFYNDPYITYAINSVLSQTYPDIEIIVINDGSTQHTELIAPFKNSISYLLKNNGGTASALNHGIRNASGDYITWLSSDDIFYPEKISKQVSLMLSINGLISLTNFDTIDEHHQILGRAVGPLFNNAFEFYNTFLHGNPINGCTVMMKKELLQNVGMFDEGLPFTHDYDLWVRIMLAGVDFHILNESLTQYRLHPAMGTARHKGWIKQEILSVRVRYYHSILDFVSVLPRG